MWNDDESKPVERTYDIWEDRLTRFLVFILIGGLIYFGVRVWQEDQLNGLEGGDIAKAIRQGEK